VVTSSVNPSTYGQSVTFTATINGEYGLVRKRNVRALVKGRAQDVSGTVTWSANTGCGVTTVTTGNPGVATCTTSSLPLGTDTITATYSGDSNHAGSTGTLSGGQVVNQVVTTTEVLSSLDPSVYGQGVSFSATVTGNSPTGTVQFNVDGSAFGSPVTLVSGTATSGSIATLGVGTHSVTAVYSGDTNNQGSTGTLSGGQVVNTATAGVVVTSSVNPSGYGQSVTFTATINGEYGLVRSRKNGVKAQDVSGTVTWSANTGCGKTTVTTGNPGVATCTTSSLPTGTDTITATYSGDSNHAGSTGTLSGGQVVQSGATTSISVTSVSPTSEAFGQDQQIVITAVLSWTGSGVAPTASAVSIGGNGPSSYGTTSCGAPSGDTITCTNTYTPTVADSVGSYTETATFAGDSNYSGSSSTQTNNFAITQATSSTSVTSSVNPSTYGQSVTFTATIDGEYELVRGRNGATLGRILVTRATKARAQDVSGTVTWSANTGCGATTVTTGNPGTATCTTSSLAGGTDTITATYSGDGNHSGSTGTLSGGQVVNPASQTITFTLKAPSTAEYGTSFTVAASATSELLITYSSAGSCTNVGPTYTMSSGTGTCTVTASQPGNNDYQAASPVSESTTAERANPTVTFTGAPATAPYNSTFVMTATTNASSVAYITTNNPTTCSLSGPYSPVTVTMLKSSGKCTFTASWGADQNYNPTTTTQTTTAEKATPVISWSAPAAITYGTPLSTTQLDATANVAGSFTYSPAAGMIESAGDVTLKVTFKPTSTNYNTATDSVTLQVLETATVTTITTPSETVTLNRNGVATATLHFNVTSYKPTGSVTLTASTGETCSGTLTPTTGDGSCKLTFNSTGTRTIIASYAGDSNHTGSNSSGQNPAVTVTVDPF
jgi:large repetitive protein